MVPPRVREREIFDACAWIIVKIDFQVLNDGNGYGTPINCILFY